jgi:hypothetical protein
MDLRLQAHHPSNFPLWARLSVTNDFEDKHGLETRKALSHLVSAK